MNRADSTQRFNHNSITLEIVSPLICSSLYRSLNRSVRISCYPLVSRTSIALNSDLNLNTKTNNHSPLCRANTADVPRTRWCHTLRNDLTYCPDKNIRDSFVHDLSSRSFAEANQNVRLNGVDSRSDIRVPSAHGQSSKR